MGYSEITPVSLATLGNLADLATTDYVSINTGTFGYVDVAADAKMIFVAKTSTTGNQIRFTGGTTADLVSPVMSNISSLYFIQVDSKDYADVSGTYKNTITCTATGAVDVAVLQLP